MLDVTDMHARFLYRLISKNAYLYTEMITSQTIIHHKNQSALLNFNEEEHPIALQLGGCDPKELAYCAKLAEKAGYDEINLNIGCPSPRVQKGAFGACLMAEPALVAQCVEAIKSVSTLPVTIKSRIGIDHQDSLEFLQNFIDHVSAKGVNTFIIHARSAWLKGLNPKQNREIPPLNYERVYQIKKLFSHLTIIINGGITTPEEGLTHLNYVDGIMLGRAIMYRPFLLCDVDAKYYNQNVKKKQQDTAQLLTISEEEIIEKYVTYAETQFNQGVRTHTLIKPILGLFHGERGSRFFRRVLSVESCQPNATPQIIIKAVKAIKNAKNSAMEL